MSLLSFLINHNKLLIFFLIFFSLNIIIAFFRMYKDIKNKLSRKEIIKNFQRIVYLEHSTL